MELCYRNPVDLFDVLSAFNSDHTQSFGSFLLSYHEVEVKAKSYKTTSLGTKIKPLLVTRREVKRERLELLAMQQQWLTMTRLFFYFTRNILKEPRNKQLNAFLQQFDLNNTDIAVMQFWRAAIDKNDLRRTPNFI